MTTTQPVQPDAETWFQETAHAIKVFVANTPNGHKPVVLLEELGLQYELVQLPLQGEQHSEGFRRWSPAGKIPALIDARGGTPFALFESGAILWYLATQAERLLPQAPQPRAEVHGWLMYQMSTVGPYLGQLVHFLRDAPQRVPYAIERYQQIGREIFGVLELRLTGHQYLAGGEYTIADIATWPWVRMPAVFGIELHDYPAVTNWVQIIAQRPAVKAAMARFTHPRPAFAKL